MNDLEKLNRGFPSLDKNIPTRSLIWDNKSRLTERFGLSAIERVIHSQSQDKKEVENETTD